MEGREVYVEVHLRGGSGSHYSNFHNAKTMLYSGIYAGIDYIGSKEMLVLKDAWHYNQANIKIGVSRDSKTSKIASCKTVVCKLTM